MGKFKDECSGGIIKEFIGIRSKCYFIDKGDGAEIKKIKGIKRNVVKNEIFREDFFKCVSERGLQQHRTMRVIRSKGHDLYSQCLNKVALNNYDDKRFPIPHSPLQTLALGHVRIDDFYALFIDLPDPNTDSTDCINYP